MEKCLKVNAKEDCVLALEIAETIPDHVANLGEASEGAEEAYDERLLTK